MWTGLPLGAELAVVLALTAWMLHLYGDWRRQHVLVTLATLVGWYFSFLIIFVLPLDVSQTFYLRCLSEANATTTVAPTTTTTMATALETNSDNLSSSSSSVEKELQSLYSTPSETYCETPGGYVNDRVLYDFWRVV